MPAIQVYLILKKFSQMVHSNLFFFFFCFPWICTFLGISHLPALRSLNRWNILVKGMNTFCSASKFFPSDATCTLKLARGCFKKKQNVKKKNMDLFYTSESLVHFNHKLQIIKEKWSVSALTTNNRQWFYRDSIISFKLENIFIYEIGALPSANRDSFKNLCDVVNRMSNAECGFQISVRTIYLQSPDCTVTYRLQYNWFLWKPERKSALYKSDI